MAHPIFNLPSVNALPLPENPDSNKTGMEIMSKERNAILNTHTGIMVIFFKVFIAYCLKITN